MAAEELWYFAKDHLMNTPSRKCGIDPDKELSYRQQAANFIQDMGQRLNVNQLCINTAIVYMHRFYMFHPFTKFHRNSIATCALFLAAKVEEQPRKLEHVIRVAHMCLHRDDKPLDAKSEAYLERAQELVGNENIMLPTLGFDVAIDHPHTHVVKCCQLVRASKDLAQTSYFMATNSLHLTTMCLQYKPTVVACVCIHLACKWANWEIRRSSEGKDWFWYVDKNVTSELLEELTAEFLAILDKCPSRLKRKIKSATANKSDKDGAGGKKADDPSSTEEYTMADMNQYHDLRIDRADWKEVTRSTKSADKVKSSDERKTGKTEPGLVPPSPQLLLKTPSPQKSDQPLPGAETTDNSQGGVNCTPSPSVAKKQKLSTPKQSRDKKDAERREVRERERAIAQAKQNVKTEKERSARVSNQNVDAVVASVSAGDVPKMAARPQPAPTQHAAQVSSLNNNSNNNHKQHDAATLERRKAGQLPGPAGEPKENSHANGRHAALGAAQSSVHTHTQPAQHHDRESDGSALASVQGFGLAEGGTSNSEPPQPKHKDHHGHGSRNSVAAHHHHFAPATAGKVHAFDAKEKEKGAKQHGRLKTPPAALMEPVHQPHQVGGGGGGEEHHQHQFLAAQHPVAFVKQEMRVLHQAPVFRSPDGGGGSALTAEESPADPASSQHRHNPLAFGGGGGGDGVESRAAEKSERKEKHKHKNRTKERSKTRDRDKEHSDPIPVNPNVAHHHHHHHHQGIKLTIPRDKLGCDDDAVDASLPAVSGGQSSGPFRTAPLGGTQQSAPPPLYHVQQPNPQGHGPSPPIVGLKIKIPKEKLMTPNANSQNSSVAGAAGGRGGLKITISKARLNAAKAFQVLDAVPRGSNDVTVAPPVPVPLPLPLPPLPHPLPAVAKESRKRATSGKDVAATKPKVARQTARSGKGGEQTLLPPNPHVTVSDVNALASSQQMSMLTPFQASLMTAPEAALRPFQGQGYNQDAAPKMTGTRRGGHAKRGVVADNPVPAPVPNMFHQMNAGPYPYQQYFPHYQNHYFPQPPPDFRYFQRNRPPMPPPLPSGPPPEAPPPPPPPPLHE